MKAILQRFQAATFLYPVDIRSKMQTEINAIGWKRSEGAGLHLAEPVETLEAQFLRTGFAPWAQARNLDLYVCRGNVMQK